MRTKPPPSFFSPSSFLCSTSFVLGFEYVFALVSLTTEICGRLKRSTERALDRFSVRPSFRWIVCPFIFHFRTFSLSICICSLDSLAHFSRFSVTYGYTYYHKSLFVVIVRISVFSVRMYIKMSSRHRKNIIFFIRYRSDLCFFFEIAPNQGFWT